MENGAPRHGAPRHVKGSDAQLGQLLVLDGPAFGGRSRPNHIPVTLGEFLHRTSRRIDNPPGTPRPVPHRRPRRIRRWNSHAGRVPSQNISANLSMQLLPLSPPVLLSIQATLQERFGGPQDCPWACLAVFESAPRHPNRAFRNPFEEAVRVRLPQKCKLLISWLRAWLCTGSH